MEVLHLNKRDGKELLTMKLNQKKSGTESRRMQESTEDDGKEEHGQSRAFLEWGYIQAYIKVPIMRNLQI